MQQFSFIRRVWSRSFFQHQHYTLLTPRAKMCILFSYCGDNDADSDYKLILAENRDEYYDRPALNMSLWDNSSVVAGRDLGAPDGDGTWLAVSPKKKKLGVLLNLPYNNRADAKSRGRLVTDYVLSDCSVQDYIQSKNDYFKETNQFVLVTYDFGSKTEVHTYSNSTNKLCTWEDPYLGFSNSLPEKPLMKTEAGRLALCDICTRLKKVSQKEQLVEELLALLRSKEQHLPDQQLQSRTPAYQQLSSIFVSIPKGRYGTRTHTIMLLTKTGHLELIEISLQAPINLVNPNWKRTEYHTDIELSNDCHIEYT